MQKRSRMPRDINQLAHMIGRMATGQAPPERLPKKPPTAAVATRRAAHGDDPNVRAFRTVARATGSGPDTVVALVPVAPGKNPHAQALGRLGGLKGGPARKDALTADQRSEIASKAAKARWSRKGSERGR